ncbi:MAG: hypothetical protein ACYSVY_22660, partial [Planctomycetota bacterium]
MVPRRLIAVATVALTLALAGLPADAQKIYWTDVLAHSIQRANLDGSNPEPLITTPVDHPTGIAVDAGAGKVYWADGPLNGPNQRIQRANLDGTEVEDLVTGQGTPPREISLDPAAGKMYWGADIGIWRADLDGSNV